MPASELITASERKKLISNAKELWHPGPARDAVKLERTLAEAVRLLKIWRATDGNYDLDKETDAFLQNVEGEK